ncbi:chromatin/chromatin-binding, or -regulatory protein [Lithospermum erythrorhizon]|uniref:HMG-Y-related protein A n=1 Tax=Lithospermum erythrorhizon TaxID=34254 RepID=A0AAV3RLC3_LITER
MATEEVSKPPSLPPYPQMIMEAIDALGPHEGSNKSSISKFMESKYGPLPAGHANLLTAHLNRLKDGGELVFFKNNYLRPDPNAPPKRGRGRPPKQKEPMPEGEVPSVTRPRGRPRKDPNAPPAPKKVKTIDVPSGEAPTVSQTGRPRGRPRKLNPQSAVEAS